MDEMTTAICTTRDCLVNLLRGGRWCQAKFAGQALEILINLSDQQTSPSASIAEAPTMHGMTTAKRPMNEQKRKEVTER